jgi:hypothetical protein
MIGFIATPWLMPTALERAGNFSQSLNVSPVAHLRYRAATKPEWTIESAFEDQNYMCLESLLLAGDSISPLAPFRLEGLDGSKLGCLKGGCGVILHDDATSPSGREERIASAYQPRRTSN